MPSQEKAAVGGIDAGTECVKAIVLSGDGKILGRTVVPSRGYFQDRIHDALNGALLEAQLDAHELKVAGATGFGALRAGPEAITATESVCHARGAFYHFPESRTVVDIGGREPGLIRIDETGRPTESHLVRQCAVGIGTFLMFAARHLDVSPTRLMELATTADRPAPIGSYCSVFAQSEILERLRGGATREEIALGCVQAIADRIFEMGGFEPPVVVTGGVAVYFPGVLKVLEKKTGLSIQAVPEPIFAGALGAALIALEAVERVT